MNRMVLSVLGLSTLLSASAFANPKSVWGKALKAGTTASVPFSSIKDLKLSAAAKKKVFAATKPGEFSGPVGRYVLTLNSSSKTAKNTFAVHIVAPGPDTNSSDFYAQDIVKVFDRKSGSLLATHKVAWDGNSTLQDGWLKK